MYPRRPVVVKPQSGLQSDINVTPLVDVVLVLLIIFMVVTPLMRGELRLQIPPSGEVEYPPSNEGAPGLVRLSADGRLFLEGEPVSEADYVPRLRAFLAARPRGERELFFQPDAQASYARLIQALDGAKAAGAEAMGIGVDPP
ncbi:biopolymer transport protein2C ExbD/TolR family [Corallococcus coralloides DSM 2259]|uniref:Biopolymer transport protein2C ExbD/TolR family n=1 Tax=Corallococcus coralloides (strain ATCC 25202 / DSM 2259 / NBRC 100086 / M2) TaxID=1144275 RepID=H8MEJ9_CORCM|nr:biopolymer transporter ExbD [Corallococcus coralloides]AFE03541.1 biopolymer transport protein2C ExbD/TolR family [Corallococcus coralloides DSM 2259]